MTLNTLRRRLRALRTCNSDISTLIGTIRSNLKEKRVPLIVVIVADHDSLNWNWTIARIEGKVLRMQPLRHIFAVRKGSRQRYKSDRRRNASQHTPHCIKSTIQNYCEVLRLSFRCWLRAVRSISGFHRS